MNYNKKSIEDINVSGKRVLCRCDFNVPTKNGKITCQCDKRNRRYNDQCIFQRSSHFCPLLSNGSVHSWQKLRRACALIPPTCPAIIMPMGLPPQGYGCR